MVRTVWMLTLIGAGCNRVDVNILASPAEVMEQATPVGSWIQARDGSAPLSVSITQSNFLGAPVGPGVVDVMVNGAMQPVEIDGTGRGSLVLDVPGVYELVAGSQTESVVVVEGEWGRFPLPVAVPPQSTTAAEYSCATDSSVVIATGQEVWWVSELGEVERIYSSPTPVVDLQCADINADEVTDVAVVTETAVGLLQGPSMAWTWGLQAPGFAPTAIAIGDVSGDELVDLVITWADGEQSGVVDIWEGDAQWGFSDAGARRLKSRPMGVGLADVSGRGTPEITVSGSDYDWQRFFGSGEGRYTPLGPIFEGISLPVGPVMRGVDFANDGGEDVIMTSMRSLGEERDVFAIDLMQENPQYIAFDWLEAWLAVAEVDGDGRPELVSMSSDGAVTFVGYDEAQSGVDSHVALTGVLDPGPIALPTGRDLLASDVAIAGSQLWRRTPGVIDDNGWSSAPEPWTDLEVRSTGLVVAADLNGDPSSVEVVGYSRLASSNALVVSSISRVDQGVTEIASIDVASEAVDPTDVAWCAPYVYSLFEDQIVQTDLSTPSNPQQRTAFEGGTGLDCRSGQGVLIANADTVVELDESLVEVQSISLPGVVDVGWRRDAMDLTIDICVTAGCSIRVLPLTTSDGVRVEVSAISSEGALEFAGLNAQRWSGAGGDLSVVDVDRNGSADLLSHTPDGGIWLFRTADDRLLRPQIVHSSEGLVGPVVVAEITNEPVVHLVAQDITSLVVAGISAP